MKWLFVVFLLISSFASGQGKVKCYDYPPISNVKGDTLYAYKECGKPWTVNNPDKAIAFITATGSKLYYDYYKLSTKMDSLQALDRLVIKRALSLSLAWMVMLNSYQLDAQNKGLWRKWVDIPSAPTLNSPHTTIPTDDYANGLFTYTNFGGTAAVGKDVRLNGNFTFGISCNSFGTTVIPNPRYRFVNFDANTIIGSVAGTDHGFQTIGPGGGLDVFAQADLFGLSAAAPMIITAPNGNGIQLISTSFGSDFRLQNIVIKSPGTSGVTCNAGGTLHTERLSEKFVRVFNTGQEGFYDGNSSVYSDYLNYDTVIHCYGYIMSREFLQKKHINHLYVRNCTGILSGQTGGGSQDHSLEIQDVAGEIGYSIFDSSPTGPSFFTHGFRFHHNFVSWDTNIGIIGRTDDKYFAASPRMTGDTVIIENDCFRKNGASSAYVWDLQERTAPVIVRNCTFDNCATTAIFQDNRVPGYTNTFTGTVGTFGNVSGTCPAPSYVSGFDNQNDPEAGRSQTSDPYYVLHYGYRTP